MGKKLTSLREIGNYYIRTSFIIDFLIFIAIILNLTSIKEFIYFRLIVILKLPDSFEKLEKLEVYFI